VITTRTALRHDSLGIVESVVMGVAGTAPAFSVAATTAALVASMGKLAPASLVYCGLIMFGVTFAYMHLNRLNPNAGASYAWVASEFGPVPGFFAGWALLVASAVFMVSGTIPAATATLLLLNPAMAANPASVTLVAAGWLVLVSAVVIKGIKLTSYTQVIMTAVEVAILMVLVIAALAKAVGESPDRFSLHWFSLAAFTPQSFTDGALIALFFFWGWDVTLNLNEETRDPARAPGYGALMAMIIVLVLFVTFVTAAQVTLSDAEIQHSGTNVVFAVAEKLFPRPWSYLAVIAVMLSTIGTLETSILQFTRTLYAKGRDGALHRRYAILHKTWKTPWVATLVITFIGLVLLLLSSFYTSVNRIIRDSVSAIGVQVALYYALAGLACAWHHRKNALKKVSTLVFLFLWPAASAMFLVVIALYSIPTFDLATKVVGIGGIAIGVVPLMLNALRR
jgi:amino acid transporter